MRSKGTLSEAVTKVHVERPSGRRPVCHSVVTRRADKHTGERGVWEQEAAGCRSEEKLEGGRAGRAWAVGAGPPTPRPAPVPSSREGLHCAPAVTCQRLFILTSVSATLGLDRKTRAGAPRRHVCGRSHLGPERPPSPPLGSALQETRLRVPAGRSKNIPRHLKSWEDTWLCLGPGRAVFLVGFGRSLSRSASSREGQMKNKV